MKQAVESSKRIYVLENKEGNIREKTKANKRVSLLLKLPGRIIIKYILCCLNLREISRLKLVCLDFSFMIKSNRFLSQYIKDHEKTYCKINLFAFGKPYYTNGDPSKNQPQSDKQIPEENKEIMATLKQDDPETQIDVAKRIVAYLYSKLKSSNENYEYLQNNINIIKTLLEMEKESQGKATAFCEVLRLELEKFEDESKENEEKLNIQLSELESKVPLI